MPGVRHGGHGHREIWVLRLEADVLTGASGPLRDRKIPAQVAELNDDDRPDDLEWILRAWEHFEVLASH